MCKKLSSSALTLPAQDTQSSGASVWTLEALSFGICPYISKWLIDISISWFLGFTLYVSINVPE